MNPPTRTYPCQLDRVVDGDTVRLVVDHGFYISSTQIVRLVGVNAPERFAAGGPQATAFVAEWFKVFVVGEEWPYLLTSLHTVDKYGRRLGYVVRSDGADLATDIIKSGHGTVRDVAS